MTITPESTMAAVDAALAPALKNLDAQGGAVNVSSIKHVLLCVRQALAHAVYGAEPMPEPEIHDVATEQRKAADAERAKAEQDKADAERAKAEQDKADAERAKAEQDKADATTTEKLFG